MDVKIEWFIENKEAIQSEILMTKGNENLSFQLQCSIDLREFCRETIWNYETVINKEKWTSKETCIEELEAKLKDIDMLLNGTKNFNFGFQTAFLEVKQMYVRRAISLFKGITTEH